MYCLTTEHKVAASEEPTWEPVIVTWIDASSESSKSSKAIIKTYEPCYRKSIGFLLVEDDERVVIAMEDDREANMDTLEDCDTITTIPAAMVQKIQRLSIKRK
jgi:hypothetical protein